MPPCRGEQPVGPAPGIQFTTPLKKRDKRKTTTRVLVPGHAIRLEKNRRRLDALLNRPSLSSTSTAPEIAAPPTTAADSPSNFDNAGDSNDITTDPPDLWEDVNEPTDLKHAENHPPTPNPRNTLPHAKTIRLYSKWAQLVPNLVDGYLNYLTSSLGQTLTPVGDLDSNCQAFPTCSFKSTAIQCLFFDRKSYP